MAYEAVLEALEVDGRIKSRNLGNVGALCPAHDDTNASLSLSRADDGRALLYCHAGCPTAEVVEALGLTLADLGTKTVGPDKRTTVAAVYTYRDEQGIPLYRVLRLSPKGFFQERLEEGEWKPGMRETRRILYHLDRIIAHPMEEPLYVVEGEKDADNIIERTGRLATTLIGGANKWRDEYLPYFADRDVIIVVDKDDPGRDHAAMLCTRLSSVANSVTVKVPAVGKDVSDHLLSGLGLEDLVQDSEGLDEFGPLDWEGYTTPDTTWLLEPYIPLSGRVLAFGPAGSLKSLWAMWAAVHLAKQGKRVAYFSLEMLPSVTAARLKQLAPPRDKFLCFTRDLKLGSPSHTQKLIAGLRDFDLIVIDSWSSARAGQYDSNADVADIDTNVFLPIINITGAAILIIDNTGHDVITDAGKIKADHARGASAKGDKMEVTLWFQRPIEDNNYRTIITCKKMRLDYPMPSAVTIETPRDRIEFYRVDSEGNLGQPMWKGMQVLEDGPDTATSVTEDANADVGTDLTPSERRALARVKDAFKHLGVGSDTGADAVSA